MTESTQRHPFIDDLGEDVVLISSVLRKPVRGREIVLKTVRAGAANYLTQSTRFLGHFGERSYFDYDVTLAGGLQARGLVSIIKDGGGRVTELNIAFSPLGSVLAMAEGVRERLKNELGADFLL